MPICDLYRERHNVADTSMAGAQVPTGKWKVGSYRHLPPLMWETLGQGVRSPAGAQFQTSASVPTVRPYVADDFFSLSYRLPAHGSFSISRC